MRDIKLKISQLTIEFWTRLKLLSTKKITSYTWKQMWYTNQNLINKRHGSQMLKETASRPNQTSYRKFYVNEVVQNSLCL